MSRKRNMIEYRSLLLFFMLVSINVWGQESGDSTTLEYDKFMEIVRMNHPMSKAAALQSEKGEAYLLKAKGELDPKVQSSLGQKYFDGKQYYSLLDAGLKIPTWVGVDVNAGFDQTTGVFLNPENSTPQGGLVYAGISVPIGQGLFMDERRSAIQQAQVYQTITESERRLKLNDLYYKAGKAYWDWYAAYMIQEVYQDAVNVSEQRLEGVKLSIELGDRPHVDTLEAGIQVQNRRLKLQAATLDYENSKARLSLFLWADGKLPMELEKTTIPFHEDTLVVALETLPIDTSNIDTLLTQHPSLLKYGAKKDRLDIQSKWQKEQLKPTLNLKYNPITEPVGGNPFSDLSINNYTWGFEFSMPIFLRKERGGLKLLDVQSKEIDYQLDYARQTIKQQTLIALNVYLTTKQQFLLYRQNRADYGRLLEGERTMFDGGESSLFMVNSRETAYISAQIQLIKTLAMHEKAYLQILYATGSLDKN